MEQDLVILQNISDTLKAEPSASQRKLAMNANISLSMMNAILGRFVERGWIMLTNVNARKLAYALTFEGMDELTKRSRKFAKRTFEIANNYNSVLTDMVLKVKADGFSKLVLYGKSYISFLIKYICNMNNLIYEEQNVDTPLDKNYFCLVGELENQNKQDELCALGGHSILSIITE